VGEVDEDVAAADMLRGHLEYRGPSTAAMLSDATGLPADLVLIALARLEAEGFAVRGKFTAPDAAEEFCARRLLARVHGYTRQRQRREIDPVSARDFMRFLLRWQHVAPGTQREGRFGVTSVVEQLQGFELAAGAWESHVLAARVTGYRRDWLDDLCISGQVSWGRLSVRDSADPGGRPPGPPDRRSAPGGWVWSGRLVLRLIGTGRRGDVRCEWSPAGRGAAAVPAVASARWPCPCTHSGSGPSSGSPVKNLAAMQPPRHSR
jgi:hypothetical protein